MKKTDKVKIAELESEERILISNLEETTNNTKRLELINEISKISDEINTINGINKEYQINTKILPKEYISMSEKDIKATREKLGINLEDKSHIKPKLNINELIQEDSEIEELKSRNIFKRIYYYLKNLL